MYTQFLKPVSNCVFSSWPHVTKSTALTALFPHTCLNYFCFRVPWAQQKNTRERNHQQNNLRSLVLNPRRTNHRQWSPRRVAMHCSSNALNQTQLLHVQKSILRRTARKDMMRVKSTIGISINCTLWPLEFSMCTRPRQPPTMTQPASHIPRHHSNPKTWMVLMPVRAVAWRPAAASDSAVGANHLLKYWSTSPCVPTGSTHPRNAPTMMAY